jgi:alkylresorcinol/alkylpyrone synthase
LNLHTPSVLALATGVPEARYRQSEIAEYFSALWPDRSPRVIRTIFERSGVGFRHMAVNNEFYGQPRTTQERNDRYMPIAIALGEDTIRRGLDSANVRPDEIDDFLVVSCTGFNVPGLDLHLAGRLGMRPDVQRANIFGMGCYGSFPGLLRARQAAAFGRRALMLSVELCSLHLQYDDTPDNVVACSLFADGAGMALVGFDDGRSQPAPRLLQSATYSDFKTLDQMTFTVTDHGFRMYLSSYVPELLAANIERFIGGLLTREGLTCRDVQHWGIHPGSAKIIDNVRDRLGLSDDQVASSHQILHDYGNMSSATILFVLEHIQQCEKPQPGAYGVLMAFGPGLTMEGLLVQW